MKKIIIILIAAMLAGCTRRPQAEAPAPKTEAADPLKATVWTKGGELYLEYPAFVLNRKERLAI